MAAGLLVQRAYDTLETMTSGRHLSAMELRRGVEAIGQRLVDIPPAEWSGLSFEPSPTEPAAFDVVVPLWTAAGPCGTGLSLRLVATTHETFHVEVEGFFAATIERVPPSPQVRTNPTRAQDLHPGSATSSDNPVPERWRPCLSQIVHRLVIRDYSGLAADGLLSYTTDPKDTCIGRWIEDYPATLVDLPSAAWTYSDHSPLVGERDVWWVSVDL